jgi:ElaB/YqjD/DUF883 family membrane-anchored ribosome-binding protein
VAKKTKAKPEEKPALKSSTPTSREKAEDHPQVRLAAEAVAQARRELEAAQELYEKFRRQATEKLQALRESTLGDALEGTRCFVKKYPGISVVLGAVLGFCLGRLFQKLFRR